MAVRHCSYKNCENYTVNAVPQGTKFFSLFGFPKDEERRNIWLKLGKVPSAIPDRHLYICSDHFHKKYIIVNQRRSTLVSTAVPFAYDDTSTTSKQEVKASTLESDIEDEELLLSVQSALYEGNSEEKTTIEMLRNDGGDYDCVESTTKFDDAATNNEMVEIEHLEYEIDSNSEATSEEETLSQPEEQKGINLSNLKKRKIVQFSLPKTTSDIPIKKATVCERTARFQKTDEQKKIIINKTVQKVPATTNVKENNQVKTGNDDTELMDATHTTTFIYKGEEYIQMPKKRYIQEKIELQQKVKKYERVLLGLKKQLDDIYPL